MKIHPETVNVRLNRRTGISQDRLNSGLSGKEYCIQNHLLFV